MGWLSHVRALLVKERFRIWIAGSRTLYAAAVATSRGLGTKVSELIHLLPSFSSHRP